MWNEPRELLRYLKKTMQKTNTSLYLFHHGLEDDFFLNNFVLYLG